MPHSPDELRALVEEHLDRLELWPQLHGQAESVRYSLVVGGKRVRPVICLAVGRGGRRAIRRLRCPAACALELVHTFSLVHDDLPALDDDEERRGQPSTWKQYGEAIGHPRRRRAARGGVPARAHVRDAARRARARARRRSG